jgi:hypothetical protein
VRYAFFLLFSTPLQPELLNSLYSFIMCSITYTSIHLTKQIPVQALPNSYVKNALNSLKPIRVAIRCDKSPAASGLNLPIFRKLSAVLNRLQAKPLPSRSLVSWSSTLISYWPWPEKSPLNFKPLSVNDQNYSPTLSAP